MTRPAWVDPTLFPFESRFKEIDGTTIHYVDEGKGPVLLMLHGNPTWSFLYRHLIAGLKERFRCIALDYPGFGLSKAPAGYAYTVAEHARVVERFVTSLDLEGITPIVQDWGGPIGFAVAVRHPDRFQGFVIGNTWAWPTQGDRRFEIFSKLLGSQAIGGFLVKNLDIFHTVFLKGGMRLKKLTPEEVRMYRMPHPTPASRLPVHVMPREILSARPLLEEVQRGISRVTDRPVLIVWGNRDPAFRKPELVRWERTFPNHRTVILDGASHFIQDDAPEEIIAAIKDWWPGS
jgi:haloalkane dehalogenase